MCFSFHTDCMFNDQTCNVSWHNVTTTTLYSKPIHQYLSSAWITWTWSFDWLWIVNTQLRAIMRENKYLFALIYSFIGKLCTLVECFKRISGAWCLIIVLSYRIYCQISKRQSKLIKDPIEIAPLSQWLMFLLRRFVVWFQACII